MAGRFQPEESVADLVWIRRCRSSSGGKYGLVCARGRGRTSSAPPDGKIVVARTRDGGQTYDILRNGLPQDHACDLTYHHGLDIDASGSLLAFGSTTGSICTEDQGDSWQAISEHLLPIYCVRFAV